MVAAGDDGENEKGTGGYTEWSRSLPPPHLSSRRDEQEAEVTEQEYRLFVRARSAYRMLYIFPGIKLSQLGRRFGLRSGDGLLCAMQRLGFLAYMDEDNGLHPFKIVGN